MAYFDHNSTTPLSPLARVAWGRAQDEAWQNPGSPHQAGARVRALWERERGRLAALLGCPAEGVLLTSGATEGANAVLAHLAARAPGGSRVLVNPTEHSCVLRAAERWFPGRIGWLRADTSGVVDLVALQEQLRAGDAGAVAVMAANNETGVLQPWREVAALCRAAGAPYLCDAAQWLGKLPAAELGATGFVLGAPHKFGGPKGCGLLVLPAGGMARGFSFLVGGGQQDGRRAGTEDYPALAATAAALAEAEEQAAHDGADAAAPRARFEQDLAAAIPGVRIVGTAAARLWNTSLVLMPAGDNLRWVTKLDRRGFEVGTTAACAAAQGRSSHVLAALGVAPAEARRVLRFSGGRATGEEDWRGLLAALCEVWGEIGDAGPVVR